MFALGSAASAQYPRWLHGATGFARAVELQRELNISLVLYFYKDRCSDCRTLEEQYLTDQFVHRALQRSIAVRINPDYGVEEHRIAERYGVVSYPAFLILDNESAPARNVQPFRRDGNHLTPEQFARACEKLMTWLPIAPKVAPDPSRESHDRANARAVMNATRQTRNPQIVELGAKPSASPVESKPTPLPTIDELLKTYVNAIGGREAHEKLKSRVIKGRIDLAGAESWGQLEIYGKAPNKSLTVMNVQPMGQVKHGYDGCTAWNAGDTVGLKTLTGPALAHFATNSDFYRELKLKDLYPGLRLMGRMKEKDREFFLVEGFPVTGGAEIMYFDSKTGFLTGRDVTQQTPQGPIRVEMRYGDWRDVDGVKLPFKIIQIMPNLKYVFTVREVKHNQPVDDKLFEKP
jgi:thiol-disulfide isomerase/thioredoxin